MPVLMGADFSARDLANLEDVNRMRAGGVSPRRRSELEAWFDDRFAASERLAVYGSLAPGRSNHHHLANIDGEWIAGFTVRGELRSAGWGDALGYPALRWSVAGPQVAVDLLVAADLRDHWPRLDAFEGADYRRILVPVLREDRIAAVANLYEISRI